MAIAATSLLRMPAARRSMPRSLGAGHYDIERVLNVMGARSIIWGHDRELHRSVLIERIAGASSLMQRRAVERTPQLMALEHAAVARCVDLFMESEALYCVQITGEGECGSSGGEQLTFQQIAAFGAQTCSAVSYLARQSMKLDLLTIDPSTIFLTRGGRAKCIDLLGLVGVHVARKQPSRFAAPHGHTAQARAAFAIGATLHALLTEWQGIYRQGAPATASLCPDLPTDYATTIDSAISGKLADCEQLRYALLPFA